MTIPEQLDAQLRALETSCQAFDAGQADEALRLALPLRIIFHHTADAPSLVAQLGARFVNLVSTAEKIPDYAKYWPSLVGWDLQPNDMVFVGLPRLTTRTRRPVAYAFWWDSETIYKFDHTKIRRSDLVLEAASRWESTGASNSRHPWLADGSPWTVTVRPSGASPREVLVYQVHLATLRQIAHEVLSSPELRTLAERAP